MKLSDCKEVLKDGAEVFDKRGLCFGFDRKLGNGEVLVEILGICWTQGWEGEQVEEGLEGTGQFVVFKEDELWTEKPKQLVPTYLEADIERAKKEAELWQERATKARKEKSELFKETEDLKKRIKRVSGKYPQLEYLCDFVEGVDLWIAGWGTYGGFEVCRVSELKGDYGLRMVSIQTERVNDKWGEFFDWKLHEYSDDSGKKKSCVVGRTKEECLERLAEYLEQMGKGYDKYHWSERVLREMRDAGVTLPEAEVKFLEKKEAETEAQKKKNWEYEKKRALERAKEYGLVLKDVE